MMNDPPGPDEIEFAVGKVNMLRIHLANVAFKALERKTPLGGHDRRFGKIDRRKIRARARHQFRMQSHAAANFQNTLSPQRLKRDNLIERLLAVREQPRTKNEPLIDLDRKSTRLNSSHTV